MSDELSEARAEVKKYQGLVASMNRAYVSLFDRKNEEIRDLEAALAASDGRVAGLTRSLAEAEAVILLAQHEVGIDHPVWVTLDGYDGSMDAVRQVERFCADGTFGFPFSMTRGSKL